MPQLARHVVKERARRLRETGEAALRRRLAAEVGSTRNVLIESSTRGRTEHFTPVRRIATEPSSVRASPWCRNERASARVLAELDVNITRGGVVWLPVVAVGPSEDGVARRIGRASLVFFQELLELDEV